MPRPRHRERRPTPALPLRLAVTRAAHDSHCLRRPPLCTIHRALNHDIVGMVHDAQLVRERIANDEVVRAAEL